MATAGVLVAAIVVAAQTRSGSEPAGAGQLSAAAKAPPYRVSGDNRSQQAKDIAKRRSAALRAGNLSAWLADIDASAAPLIAREKMRFANLRLLRPNIFDLLPHDVLAGAYITGDTNVEQASVQEIMRLPGDLQRSATTATWTINFAGPRPTITAITPGGNDYTASYAVHQPPWDDVPLRVARSRGITIAAPAGSLWNPAAYLPAAQRAAATVRAMWGKRIAVPGFVVFLANENQYTTWYDDGGDLDGSAGFTAFPPVVEADGRGRFPRHNPNPLHEPGEPGWIERAAGSRIVLNMNEPINGQDVQSVLTHEFGHGIAPHLIEAKRAELGPPGTSTQAIWPIEGFARWVESLDNPGRAVNAMRTVRNGKSEYQPKNTLFPGSDDFYSNDPGRRSFNYNLSSSLFLAAAQTGGRQKAVDLYICLTNAREFVTETRPFIDVCVKGVGLDSDKLWAKQQRLTQ
ncbi:hypothetical protein OWR29_39130 [Actinoplanes sp. Pm04-4]|uniref:Peptidase M4 C-terminal domain-containing protein n=1 Tax=Paractinoplanes pyxinae TaxID=2997416 RepID=A0ABT4BEP3_9ACTN|nr:hypothetical protein [Actinoplanes pyxinae]MCY1144045.1 hypothetical protein [Actinoplanes pyxinae]